jgi:hypothetical protein
MPQSPDRVAVELVLPVRLEPGSLAEADLLVADRGNSVHRTARCPGLFHPVLRSLADQIATALDAFSQYRQGEQVFIAVGEVSEAVEV